MSNLYVNNPKRRKRLLVTGYVAALIGTGISAGGTSVYMYFRTELQTRAENAITEAIRGGNLLKAESLLPELPEARSALLRKEIATKREEVGKKKWEENIPVYLTNLDALIVSKDPVKLADARQRFERDADKIPVATREGLRAKLERLSEPVLAKNIGSVSTATEYLQLYPAGPHQMDARLFIATHHLSSFMDALHVKSEFSLLLPKAQQASASVQALGIDAKRLYDSTQGLENHVDLYLNSSPLKEIPVAQNPDLLTKGARVRMVQGGTGGFDANYLTERNAAIPLNSLGTYLQRLHPDAVFVRADIYSDAGWSHEWTPMDTFWKNHKDVAAYTLHEVRLVIPVNDADKLSLHAYTDTILTLSGRSKIKPGNGGAP